MMDELERQLLGLRDDGCDGCDDEDADEPSASGSSLAAALARADPAAAAAMTHAADPFFVRRVLSVLPARVRGAGLSPTRRARVLAAFYGGGLALAAIVAVVVPEAVGLWSDRAHALAHDASGALGSDVLSLSGLGDGAPWLLALGVSAVLVGGALALLGVRVDTPAT